MNALGKSRAKWEELLPNFGQENKKRETRIYRKIQPLKLH